MQKIASFLHGAFVVEPAVYEDERGFFKETYRQQTWQELGYTFVQDNVSWSSEAGTIRGLHFQREPHAQAKLVQVLRGAVWDVVVDLRPDSPTYQQWHGTLLSERNHWQLLVPKGFAHGFCTLVPDTIVQYKVDAYYSPAHDGGVRWNDADLAIHWPTTRPIVSEKDAKLPALRELK